MGARVLAGLVAGALTAGAVAQWETIPVTGDRLSGFVLPVEPVAGDIRLHALRAWGWTVDDTKRLLLQSEVRVRIGTHRFTAEEVVVWINRVPSERGLINQIALYFPRLENPGERAGMGVSGDDVLVTGSARGSVELNVALLHDRPPPAGDVIRRAERRLAAHLERLRTDPPPLADRPRFDRPPPRTMPAPQPGQPVEPLALEPAETDQETTAGTGLPLFSPSGTIWFSWDDLNVTTGVDENVITATGGIVAQYLAELVAGQDTGEFSRLTLSAQRAVVFTDPGPIDELLTGRLGVESIRGIYLEGNVVATADDDRYTVRAPHIYYDLRTNQAIMLQAVLRTYNRQYGIPIYARAEEMRQIAADQWTSRRATVSTSEFFTPHLAVGAGRVTVTQRPRSGGGAAEAGDSTLFVESRHNTLEMVGVPVLYWPRFAGTVEDVPLRSFEVGANDTEGVRILTEWNAFALLGVEAPAGVEAIVELDGYTKRGPATGLDLSYDLASALGSVDLYYLHDDGVDRTSSGLNVVPEKTNRGVALWDHRQPLSAFWDFQSQLSWISDPTFITSWRERDYYNRREYETMAAVLYERNNVAFSALLKYNLNDFISNSYLLASRAYQVQRMPELGYRRFGDALFNDVVTYSSETRLGRVKFDFESGTPNELGVRAAAFGVGPNDSISAAFVAAGFPTEWVSRFDTRHELAVPLALGPVNVVPFAVGRLTFYSEDFDSFSSESGDSRWFGSVGVRMNTQFSRVDNSVENRLLDLHRLRTIIEPRITAWYGATNIPQGALPVYDQDVEAIGGASAVEFGLTTTIQTQRGGPGRWRSVDVLTVNASAVINSEDANRQSPTPQFFEYRPEYSLFGDHIFASAVWELSDHLSVVGQGTYDLDNDTLARGSIGTEMQHTPQLSTFIEYRVIEASDNELLGISWQYQLSPKYLIALRPQWDFVAEDFRAIGLLVTRRFPDFSVSFTVRRDEISNETTIGASLDLAKF